MKDPKLSRMATRPLVSQAVPAKKLTSAAKYTNLPTTNQVDLTMALLSIFLSMQRTPALSAKQPQSAESSPPCSLWLSTLARDFLVSMSTEWCCQRSWWQEASEPCFPCTMGIPFIADQVTFRSCWCCVWSLCGNSVLKCGNDLRADSLDIGHVVPIDRTINPVWLATALELFSAMRTALWCSLVCFWLLLCA